MSNQKIFHSPDGEIKIEMETFYKIVRQMQIIFNPVEILESFILQPHGMK